MIDDPDLLDLLRDEPELLAIADAVVETQRRRLRRVAVRTALAFAAAVAVAGAGALVVRQSATAGGPDRDYVHAVLVDVNAPSEWLVPLRGGAWRPVRSTFETWMTPDGGSMWMIHREAGRIVETQSGNATHASSSFGPTRLSPDLRQGAGPRPLAAVSGGYDQALHRGGRAIAGPAEIDGHRVRWLAFGRAVGQMTIALDASSGVPVQIGRPGDETRHLRITRYEIVDRRPPLPRISGHLFGKARTTGETRVTAREAAAALPGARFGDATIGGMPLRSIRLQRLAVAGRPGTRPGVVLLYGQDSVNAPLALTPYLTISEAAGPEAMYGFVGTGAASPVPPDGFMRVSALAPEARTTQWTALFRVGGLYVRVVTNQKRLLPGVAQRLRPLG